METELIVHLGVPKTGTTAIQTYLYQHRDKLAEIGVHYPDTHLDNFSPYERAAHHLHAHKWGGWMDKSKFVIAPDEAWHRLGKQMKQKSGRYVISSERLADLLPTIRGKDVIEFILRTIDPARLRFIGYVRRQDILAESFFKQRVKVQGVEHDIVSYMNALPPFLDFYRLFDTIASVVGWENVIVRVYERESLEQGDAVADFLCALKLDGLPTPTPDTTSTHASLDTLAVEVLLQMANRNHLRDSPNVMNAIKEYVSRKEFQKYQKYSLFSIEERQIISKLFQDGNIKLAEKLNCQILCRSLSVPLEHDLSQSVSALGNIFDISHLCDMAEIVRDVTRKGMMSAWGNMSPQK